MTIYRAQFENDKMLFPVEIFKTEKEVRSYIDRHNLESNSEFGKLKSITRKENFKSRK